MFIDRLDAGNQLADHLLSYKDQPNTIILALPRGGVATGAALSDKLHLPLDIIVTRKIAASANPEFAIASVSEHSFFPNPTYPFADETYLQPAITDAREEIIRRQNLYRRDLPPLNIANKTVILTDDGLATGLTAQAAASELRQNNIAKIILAVPVASPDALDLLRPQVDEVVTVDTPGDFMAVGQYYQSFPQLTDEQVINFLKLAHQTYPPKN